MLSAILSSSWWVSLRVSKALLLLSPLVLSAKRYLLSTIFERRSFWLSSRVCPDTLCCHIRVSFRSCDWYRVMHSATGFSAGCNFSICAVAWWYSSSLLFKKDSSDAFSRPNVGFGCGWQVELGISGSVVVRSQFSGRHWLRSKILCSVPGWKHSLVSLCLVIKPTDSVVGGWSHTYFVRRGERLDTEEYCLQVSVSDRGLAAGLGNGAYVTMKKVVASCSIIR